MIYDIYIYQDTRSCVSGQERRARTSVLFTQPVKQPFSAYHNSKTMASISTNFTYFNVIKTHGRVSAAKKDARAQVCYLRDRSSSRFQPIITQKLWRLFLLILYILLSPYTAPYIPNLIGIAPAVPEIRAPETCRILFVFFFFFFFFAPNN